MSIQITAKDRDGSAYSLNADVGDTVMETMRDAGLPVAAVCGGCCSCATCHVYVQPDWAEAAGPRGEDEQELLQYSDNFDEGTSRLGCQISLTDAHNGLVVTLAPEE